MHEIYHSDHLGSSSYITDNFGRPSHYYEYLPFGELMTEHNQSKYYIDPYPTQNMDSYNNPYKFNGKEMDRETGMYYYGARYYDPRISIFVSVDPLAEQTMEPYLYTGNNPIMFTDPTGMAGEKVDPRLWVYNQGNGRKEYKPFYMSINGQRVISLFTMSNTANQFLSNFMSKGDVVGSYKATQNGKFSNYDLEINFIDFQGNGNAKAVHWGNGKVEASFGAKITKSGELKFAINLQGDSSINRTLENLAHEGLLHGTDSKISSIIDYYEKNGSQSTSDRLKEGYWINENDHRAIRDKDLNHQGYRRYNSFRNEMEEKESFFNIDVGWRKTFKYNEENYGEMYKNR